jgi:hypothetical protein
MVTMYPFQDVLDAAIELGKKGSCRSFFPDAWSLSGKVVSQRDGFHDGSLDQF